MDVIKNASQTVDLETAITRGGYIPVNSFEKGFLLTSSVQALRMEKTNEYFVWRGVLPKSVSAGSTPETLDGFGPNSWVDVSNLTLRAELAQHSGAGEIRTESGKTVQEEISTINDGFYDLILFDANNIAEAFIQHNHILLRTSGIDTRLTDVITIPPYKKLTILPPKGERQVILRGPGKKIVIQRGAELYAPNLTCAAYDMDVVTIDGSSRPSMILGISEWPKIKVNIQSEYKRGRGIVMDASTNTETNKSGIITNVIIDAVIRGMHTAYIEILTRNGTETDRTYINNNRVDLTIWQCIRGLIQANYNHGVDIGVEIAANSYMLNYQTSGDSVDVLHVYGVRNVVTGIIWDYDYPKLHAESILIKGNSNIIGSKNFPSITNNFVTLDSLITTRNSYTGATYGMDRHDSGQFHMLWRPYHFSHPDDASITMPSSLFMLQAERVVTAGNLVSIVTRRIYYRSTDRLPFSMSGFAIIRNHSVTPANIRVAIGLSNKPGEHALSQTYTIAPSSIVRVPLVLYLTSDRLYGESGTTVWYGYPTYNNLDGYINLNLSITTDVPITVAGCHLSLSKYGY